MKNKNLSWFAALLVFALLLWCTAATPGKIADPSTYTCAVYSTIFSLLPPVIAIVLALNTKEVYTSLLVGIASGALLYANGNLELAINTLFFNEDGGMVAKLSDSSNVGILIFLVMLGILVALMNKAGGSAAFGRWASTHIHSRAGAQFSTLLLGVMIFVDDYFNCLTVGSVMRPVTDRQKVSRAKLAYLIDATAAPVCIIAPVSSWAAAVTSSVPEGSGINGFTMFLRTIPYNYYALLTIVMSLFLIFTGTDFGSMKLNEDNAKNGDLFTTADRPYGNDVDDGTDTCGHVADLLAPVLVLIVACIFGMIYTGGFFEGVDFVTAFADCNASAGLVLGSSIALLFTFVFYRVRNVMTFQDFAACIPEGFKAMVSPMLILSLAWTLSGMTGLLGAKYYVANLLSGSAAALQYMLPVIIFLVAVFLAFATGTSWGTFSILIPIVCHAFPEGEMLVISIAACLSGAVCGDHCSPHLGHHHYGIRRCPLQPCEPCVHPAALRHYGGFLRGSVLCDHGHCTGFPWRKRQPVHLADPAGCCHCRRAGGAQRDPCAHEQKGGRINSCQKFSCFALRRGQNVVFLNKMNYRRHTTYAGTGISGRIHQIQAAFLPEHFSAFCHPGSHADHGGVLLHGGHHGHGRTHHCGVFPHDADLHPQRGV